MRPRLFSALIARCPLCGSGGIWARFGHLVERCPRCDYKFERESGYWVGGLVVNIAFAMFLLFVIFVGGMLVTWPDVPWTPLTIVAVVVTGLSPLLLYPQSKTVWIWVDLTFNPYKGEERDWESRRR